MVKRSVLRFNLIFLVEFVLDEAALSPAITQFDIAINNLKITRFTRFRPDFENSKSCLQDLENSKSCLQNLEYSRLVLPARFATFEIFIDLAGKIKKIPNLALPTRFGKFNILPATFAWKIQNAASKIWKIQDLAGKIWKIQDLATHHWLTRCSNSRRVTHQLAGPHEQVPDPNECRYCLR